MDKNMEIDIKLSGGKKVDVTIDGFDIKTDQTVKNGGEETAPNPFNLFLASIATCAGFYISAFCEKRNINTEGIKLKMLTVGEKRVDTIKIEIKLPEDFPEKHKDVVIKAVDSCAVKKHILDPPKFEVYTI